MVREVTLPEMLDVRERRAARQRELLGQYHAPLISFTMNIPGPVKDSPLIRRGFWAGLALLEERLGRAGLPLLHREEREGHTGCEALWVSGGEALEIKRLCVQIEDTFPLGRLFDLDVLTPAGEKLDRELVGGGGRDCIVCGAPGRDCAARRLHSVPQLQEAVRAILTGYFYAADRDRAAVLATQALLDEAHTTPKPGLVDENNTGSHTDMDLAAFERSARTLTPYWSKCFELGREGAESPPEETFPALQRAGLEAERAMLEVTGGVNTHKGAIFLLGLLCAAMGRLWDPGAPCRDPEALGAECAAMVAAATAAHWSELKTHPERAATAGDNFYLQYGLTGARGEAAQGLPGAVNIALPVYETALAQGLDHNHAGTAALLHLIARGLDTNMVRRGGWEGAQAAARETQALLDRAPFPPLDAISALDDAFIAQNLSPGGCADLLAGTYLLHGWKEEN